MAALARTYAPPRATCVIADGPQATCDRWGDEYPVWFVFAADDDGEPQGKVYTCRSRETAAALAAKIAQDRRLELVNVAGPA